MNQQIENEILKPLNTEIGVLSNDIPRELQERRNAENKIKDNEKLLQAKNDIIKKLIQETKKLEENVSSDLNHFIDQEILQYEQMEKIYCEEFKKIQLICSFCGVEMNASTINDQCKSNSEEKNQNPIDAIRYTEVVPKEPYLYNNRHYFSTPLPEFLDRTLNKIAFEMISNPLVALKKAAERLNINLREEIVNLEDKSSGNIDRNKLEQFLKNIVQLEDHQIKKILDVIYSLPDLINISSLIEHPSIFENSENRKRNSERDKID